jgi:hypothetical protein
MNRHSDRFIRKGWGVSYIIEMVSMFISMWGTSIERMVFTEFYERISSLNSSLEEE